MSTTRPTATPAPGRLALDATGSSFCCRRNEGVAA